MNRPGLGQAGVRQDTVSAVYGAIIKNGKGWAPEWADRKPGEHPMLPVRPPNAQRTGRP